VALIIADVSGKDVGAALFMSLVRTLIRVFSEQAYAAGKDPLGSMKVVNNYLARNHLHDDALATMFVTIVFGLLRPSTGELRYVNAGHVAPLIMKTDATMTKLMHTSMAVGLVDNCSFKQKQTTVLPGELLLFYTDGVTDAKNPAGDFFTSNRLFELMKSECPTAKAKVDQIISMLVMHNQGAAPYDDITMLAIKRNGG
jgi:phosphoserine phosphatase RsbU/P